MDDRVLPCRVSPFRNLRVDGYLPLTAAYRSLSRLSSALSAKASTLRPSLLDLLGILHPPRCLAWQLYRFVTFWMSGQPYLLDMVVLLSSSDDLSM